MNVLDLVGLSETTVEEAKVEPRGEGFLWDSGAYKVEIKEVSIFETENKAKMLKVRMYDPETEKEITEYINTSYIDKKTKEITENKGGASIFKALLSAISLEPAQCQIEDREIDAYGKKVQGQSIKNAEGRMLYALVRRVEDPSNEKYPESNQVEGFANVEKQIGGSTEPFEKWLKKIEKQSILVKKKKSVTQETPRATDAEAAKSLLG